VVERLLYTLTRSVLDWRQEHAKGLIGEMRYLFSDQESANDMEQKNLLANQLLELTTQLKSINRARAAMSSTGRRRINEDSGSA